MSPSQMLESFDHVGCCLAKFRVRSLMFIVYLTQFHAGAIVLISVTPKRGFALDD